MTVATECSAAATKLPDEYQGYLGRGGGAGRGGAPARGTPPPVGRGGN